MILSSLTKQSHCSLHQRHQNHSLNLVCEEGSLQISNMTHKDCKIDLKDIPKFWTKILGFVALCEISAGSQHVAACMRPPANDSAGLPSLRARNRWLRLQTFELTPSPECFSNSILWFLENIPTSGISIRSIRGILNPPLWATSQKDLEQQHRNLNHLQYQWMKESVATRCNPLATKQDHLGSGY